MKVIQRKTGYMCVNERQANGTVTMRREGKEVARLEDFKSLCPTVQSNGKCEREGKHIALTWWNGWRRMSQVIWDGEYQLE